MEGSHLRRKKTQVRGVGERRGIVLLAWDQSANASSLETHAQIKTPFREDPTLVTGFSNVVSSFKLCLYNDPLRC